MELPRLKGRSCAHTAKYLGTGETPSTAEAPEGRDENPNFPNAGKVSLAPHRSEDKQGKAEGAPKLMSSAPTTPGGRG